MSYSVLTCVNCGDPHTDPDLTNDDWCWKCFQAETQRSLREDAAGPYHPLTGTPRTRPPKYVLRPSEWPKFGY